MAEIVGLVATNPNDAIRKSELDSAIAGVSGGGAPWVEAEIDFGTNPIVSKRFTITAVGVTGTSKILVLPNGKVATGRVGDDWEWDSVTLAAKPGTGLFVVSAFASGRIKGRRTIQYQVL